MDNAKAKFVIFDLDGTIADTLKQGIGVVNSLAREFGYKEIKEEDIGRLRDMDSKALLKEVGIPLWKLPLVAFRVRSRFRKLVPLQKPYAGIGQVLGRLKSLGFELGVVTSSSPENARAFLKNSGLEGHFDFIHSESNLFGKGRVIRNLLEKLGVNPAQAVYIGDETRDVEAAKQAKARSIAVSWGVNSRRALEAAGPDAVAERPEDLPDLILGLRLAG